MITNEKLHGSEKSLILANAWQLFPIGPQSGKMEVCLGLVENHKDKSKVHL